MVKYKSLNVWVYNDPSFSLLALIYNSNSIGKIMFIARLTGGRNICFVIMAILLTDLFTTRIVVTLDINVIGDKTMVVDADRKSVV